MHVSWPQPQNRIQDIANFRKLVRMQNVLTLLPVCTNHRVKAFRAIKITPLRQMHFNF